jgi:hypothetical protein
MILAFKRMEYGPSTRAVEHEPQQVQRCSIGGCQVAEAVAVSSPVIAKQHNGL